MKIIVLLLILSFSFSSHAVDFSTLEQFLNSNTSAPVSCQDESESVCENPQILCETNSPSTFEDEKYALLKKIAPDPNVDPFQKPYFDYLTSPEDVSARKELIRLNTKIETEILEKFGRTRNDLLNMFEKIKISFAKKISDDFNSNDIYDKKLVDEITQNLASIKLIAPQDFSSISELQKYLDFCGPNGMMINAFYKSGAIVICPGFLLDSFLKSKGNTNSLTFVIAHELGHSFDSTKIFGANFNGMAEKYTHFLKCMKENYISKSQEKFGTNLESIKQLKKNGIPNLKAEINRVKKIKPLNLDYLSDLKRNLQGAKEVIEMFKELAKEKDSYLMMNAELIADYQASNAIRDQLLLLPSYKRLNALKETIDFVCPSTKPNEKKIRALLWQGQNEASHPPDKFRLENMLRHPDIRALLGCSVLKKSDKPWCVVRP